MNFTTKPPVERVKCIVETENGCVFPAYMLNGIWYNSEKAFPIEGVKHWIVFPGEEDKLADCIPAEVLLKYAYRDYKEMKKIAKEESEKVKSLRELNRKLTKEYNKLYTELNTLKNNSAQDILFDQPELTQLRELSRNLTIMYQDMKRKYNEACDKRVKELTKQNNKLKGLLKSIGHICEAAQEMNNADELSAQECVNLTEA